MIDSLTYKIQTFWVHSEYGPYPETPCLPWALSILPHREADADWFIISQNMIVSVIVQRHMVAHEKNMWEHIEAVSAFHRASSEELDRANNI